MADPVLIVIDVDDRGSAALKSFNQTATQAFQQLQGASAKATTAVVANTNSLISTFERAVTVSLTFRAVSEALALVTDIFKTGAQNVLDFDAALREVASISPEVRGNFDKFREAIIATNPALGTTTELAKGLYETFSSGLIANGSANDALRFTEVAAELAKAGLTKTDVAVKVLSQSLNAYGLDASHAREFGDILFKSVELGQYRFEELAGAIGPIEPIAKALGISFADVNAVLATLSQAGFTAANGATAFRGTLVDLIQNLDKFKALGIDVKAVIAQQGIEGLFRKLASATGETVQQIKVLIPDTRALSGVMSILGQDANKVAGNFNSIHNASGSVKTAFDEIKKSGTEAIKDLSANFDRFAQVLGKIGLPPFVVAVKGASATLNFMGSSLLTVEQGAKQVGFGLAYLKDVALLGVEEANIRAARVVDKLNAGFVEQKEVVKTTATIYEELKLASERANGELLKASSGIVTAGGSSSTAASQHKLHSEALTLLAKNALIGGGNINQITERFLTAATASTDLKGRLNTLSNDIGALGDKSKKLGQEDFQSLITAFVDSFAKAEQLRAKIVSLGGDEQFLTGASKQLSDQFIVTAIQSGMSTGAIAELQVEYRKATNQLTETSGKLKEIGFDYTDVATKTAGLVEENQRLKGGIVSTDQAFQLLTGGSLNAFLTKTEETIAAVKQMKAEGKLSNDFLLDIVNKAIDAFDKFGIKVPASIAKFRDELNRTTPVISSVDAAMKLLGHTTDEVAERDLGKLTAAFLIAQNSGSTNAVKLAEDAKKISDAYKAAGLEVPVEILKAFDRLEAKGQETANKLKESIGEAAHALGLKLGEEVGAGAAKAIERVENLVANGEKNFGQLADIVRKAMDDIIASGEKVNPAYQALYDKLAAGAQKAGQQIAAGLQKGFTGAQTEIEKLNKQLEGFSFTDNFRSDLPGIVEQLQQAKKEFLSIRETPDSPGFAKFTRDALQKEIDQLTGRLQDGFKSALENAKSLTQSLGAVTLPPGLVQAAGLLNISVEKIKKDLQDILTTSSKITVPGAGTPPTAPPSAPTSGGGGHGVGPSQPARPTRPEIIAPDPSHGVTRHVERLLDDAITPFNEALASLSSGTDELGSLLSTGAAAFATYQTAIAEGTPDSVERQKEVNDLLGVTGNKLLVLTGLQGDQITIFDSANNVLLQYVNTLTDATLANIKDADKTRAVQSNLETQILSLQQQLYEKEKLQLNSGTAGSPADPVLSDLIRTLQDQLQVTKVPVDESSVVNDILSNAPDVATGMKKLQDIFNSTGNEQIRKYLTALQNGFEDNAQQIAYNTYELQKSGTAFENYTDNLGRQFGKLTRGGEDIVGYSFLTKEATANLDNAAKNVEGFTQVVGGNVGRLDSFFKEHKEVGEHLILSLKQATSGTTSALGQAGGELVRALSGLSFDLVKLRTDLSPEGSLYLSYLDHPGPSHGITIGGNQGGILPKFANGTLYANQGQVVSLEAGEAVLPRAAANAYRSGTNSDSSGSQPSVTFSTGANKPTWAGQTATAQEVSGFQFIPGLGYIPSVRLAAAAGRIEDQLGPNGQRELQRTITPMIRSSITRRDLTRPITQATALSRKGTPKIGGS